MEYLENEKSFLDEIKSSFHSFFERLSIDEKIKNLIRKILKSLFVILNIRNVFRNLSNIDDEAFREQFSRKGTS